MCRLTTHNFTNWRKSSRSGNNDCIEVGTAAWRKSSHSGTGDCIEAMAALNDTIGLRDSRDPDGDVIVLGRREWARLVDTLKASGDA